MEAIAQYVFRLVCGAVVCGLLMALTGSGGPGGKIRSILFGMFLALLAISPLAEIRLDDLRYLDPGITARAEELARSGEDSAREAMALRISEQCEAYILSKADALSLVLDAEVILDPETGIPVSVRITGNAAPYHRESLMGYITRTLGIERSRIEW